jgi:hypothetical protein
LNNNCGSIHTYCHNLPRYKFPFNSDSIPNNGIYILFEKNEIAHGVDRIVRVGTHTGSNQLVPRLKQHFLSKKKDRSIFRKNIGRAFLQRENDTFLSDWNLDLTTKKMRVLHEDRIDMVYQNLIEEKVSCYIQENFTFAIIPVDSKEDRINFESKLISSISLCKDCHPSAKWLGKNSPKKKIVESGLWQVNELYKVFLKDSELSLIFSD